MKPQSLCPSINPAAIRLLENADLLSRFNVIWPVQPLQQKYLSSHLPPNQRHNSRRLIPRRGALAIVTNVGMGCGGRGSVERETESQGGFPVSDRVSCRRTALLRTAKPCGPGTRCWCQVGGGFSNPTGGGKTFNPPMTVTRRIRRRGERGISRKTIAQGRRNAPTVPVCSCAHSFVHFAHETAGAASTRRSLRPQLGEELSTARAHGAARAWRHVWIPSLRAKRRNPSRRAKEEWIASLRSQ
jgi:hypothetical protein